MLYIQKGDVILKEVSTRKSLSIKWKFIQIIGFGWILPVLIVVGFTGYFIISTINRQLVNTAVASVESGVIGGVHGLDSIISASREASYNPAIRNAYNSYLVDGDAISLYGKVTEFLNHQYKYDDNINKAVLYFTDNPDTLYYTFRYSYVGDFKIKIQNEAMRVSETLDTGIGFINILDRIFMVRNILNSDFEPYAVLVLEMNIDNIFNSLKNLIWETQASVKINNTEIPLIMGENVIDWGKLDFPEKGVHKLEVIDNTLFYGQQKNDDYNLEYAVFIDTNSLMKELLKSKTVFYSILLIIIPLLLLVVRFFYTNISDPVGRLIKASNQIEEGHFGIQIDAQCPNKEFQYLFKAFNTMSKKLWYQFERIYREELALRDAKIMALQSQINPHFMNNTLEIINWEARMAGNIKVSEMIECLSIMLDAALDRRVKPLVHLSEEMMYVNAYLHIINERLGKRLSVEKDIDESLLDSMVPRLILQPIIENAVEHGISPRQKGIIRIRVYKNSDNNLILEIENDSPLSPQDEAHIEHLLCDEFDANEESSVNLGIRNVHQRIRMIYGNSSGLSIQTSDNGCTISKIVLKSDGLEKNL